MLKQREIPSGAINYEMCKKCGGRCCKSAPCAYLPSDFDNIEGIEDEIVTNYAIIDLFNTERERFLFLRVRNLDEDLSSSNLLLLPDNIYMATEASRKRQRCRFYKLEKQYYYGIEYDKWDEKAIRDLSKEQLENLFRIIIRNNLRDNKIKTMEECILEYLEARQKFGFGGCMLPEEKRPGGALYSIPNYKDGCVRCKPSDELYNNYWDKPEHQNKLVKILSKRGLL